MNELEKTNEWWADKYRRAENEVDRLRRDIRLLVDGKAEALTDEEMLEEIGYHFNGEAFSARQLVNLAKGSRELRISFIVRDVQLTDSYGSIGKKWIRPNLLRSHQGYNIREAHVPLGDRSEEQGKGKLYKVMK
tara:strand:- start:1119 stop:1520 length:402 start_codon:yes stop_codon:yes gene_type:complete